MPHVRVIFHKGKQLVLLDFARAPDAEAALSRIAEAQMFVQQQGKGLLLLTDVTDSPFDKRVVNALQELATHNRPYAAASAVVGMSPMAHVVHTAINRLAGRNIRAFDNMEEAKDWLVSQAPSA